VLPLLKKRAHVKGLAGVTLLPEGIGVTQVVRRDGQAPSLEVCAFRHCDSAANQLTVLESLVKQYGLIGASCTALVQPGEYNLLLVEAPDVEVAELKSAVRWRIKDLIDFHIDDAVIDVFDIPGQGEHGRNRMMYVVAARASVIQARVDLLQSVGLNLSVIDIPELAQRNIAALLPEDVSGVALLHITRSRGFITLTRQSDLYLSRVLDIGLQHLQGAQGVGEDMGLVPELSQALDTIVLEVQRSLDYYESHFHQPPINTLVITPMEEEVPSLVPHLSSNLGVAVRMLDLSVVLDCKMPLDDELQARDLLAIGAALRVER